MEKRSRVFPPMEVREESWLRHPGRVPLAYLLGIVTFARAGWLMLQFTGTLWSLLAAMCAFLTAALVLLLGMKLEGLPMRIREWECRRGRRPSMRLSA